MRPMVHPKASHLVMGDCEGGSCGRDCGCDCACFGCCACACDCACDCDWACDCDLDDGDSTRTCMDLMVNITLFKA